MADITAFLAGEDAQFAGANGDGKSVLPVLAEIFNQMRDTTQSDMM